MIWKLTPIGTLSHRVFFPQSRTSFTCGAPLLFHLLTFIVAISHQPQSNYFYEDEHFEEFGMRMSGRVGTHQTMGDPPTQWQSPIFGTLHSSLGIYFGYEDSLKYVFIGILIQLCIISVYVSRTLLAVPTGERYYIHNPSSSPCCFLSGGERGGGLLFWILGWISKYYGSFWLRRYGRAVPSSSSSSILFCRSGGTYGYASEVCF